jgi:CRISPR-associated protein Cmr4
MIGRSPGFTSPNEPAVGTVATHSGGDLIFLEEFQFTQVQVNLGDFITTLTSFGIEQTALQNQLVVMGNDDFADFCRTATAVTPHIAIEQKNKTVCGGALWYEETLPPDTLLYTMLLANKARSEKIEMNAEAVLKAVTDMFLTKPYLQIGGNETVGMGWCKVTEVKS